MTRPATQVLIIVSHPIQYFVPLFREMAGRNDIELLVLYRSDAGLKKYFDEGFGREVEWDIPLLGGYRHRFLFGDKNIRSGIWGILKEVWRFDPEVVLVHGYSQPLNLVSIGTARLFGRRVLMRGDTRLLAHHHSSPIKNMWKRMIVRLVNGCVSIGSENAKYYEWLGVGRDRIYFAPFSVANSAFDLGSAHADARRTQRISLDIAPDAKVVLFASKLIARKRAEDLLAAMDMVSARHRDAVLLIAGTGPEEPRLRELAAGRSARIVFAGFRNQSEMPALLAASDIFVLPSEEEPWGLIVNEAMAAGLPVIVSDDVGAAPDLVEGKGTGLVFPARDVARLADALDTLLGAPHLCREMGMMARNLIDRWDVKASADGIGAAARAVVRRG